MKTQTRYRVFEVKYLGATNFKGSRVKIKDLRNNKTKTIGYDHTLNSASDIAENYLESIGIKVTALGMCDNDCFLLSEDFDTDLV